MAMRMNWVAVGRAMLYTIFVIAGAIAGAWIGFQAGNRLVFLPLIQSPECGLATRSPLQTAIGAGSGLLAGLGVSLTIVIGWRPQGHR